MLAFLTYIFVILEVSAVLSQRVQTKYGPIEGKSITLFNGKKVDAFLGVPYAAPPVGGNRFASPKQVQPWTEPLETKAFQKGCIQTFDRSITKFAWYVAEAPESEDCLYLNVWRPHNTVNKSLAVMMWIHGGAFYAGANNMPLYEASILASENDVMVVSINYRLAMFGYLYLNNSEVNGNMGIQDQIQAMSWISENIENFGGDPNKVTIFGESAGGSSASFHLINPNLDNLFRNAIFESGSLNMKILTHTMEDALNNSLELGKSVGCPIDNEDKLLKCLRGKTVEDLIKGNPGSLPYLVLIFPPVRNGIEVPLDPFTAVSSVPTTKRKNLMGGNVVKEANALLPLMFPGKLLTDDLQVTQNEFRVFLTNYFGLSDERLQDVVIHDYTNFSSSHNFSQMREEASDIVTDAYFVCPDIKLIEEWSVDSNQVYYYNFRYRASKGLKITLPEWMGSSHGEEIPFVFGHPLDPKNGYTEEEKILSQQVMTLWSNFAKYGNPNGPGDKIWPPVDTKSGLAHLDIGKNIEAKRYFKEKECDFLNNLLPRLLSAQEQLENSVPNDP